MEPFIHIVGNLDSSPLSLIWIVLLIDCFVNTDLKGPQKLWWIFFILLTHFFGALLYFFLGPAQIYRLIVNKMNQPYQASDSAKTQQPDQQWDQHLSQRDHTQSTPSSETERSTERDSATYEQGYRARERVASPAMQESGPSDRLYEEPQAIYPEITQEQKSQR